MRTQAGPGGRGGALWAGLKCWGRGPVGGTRRLLVPRGWEPAVDAGELHVRAGRRLLGPARTQARRAGSDVAGFAVLGTKANGKRDSRGPQGLAGGHRPGQAIWGTEARPAGGHQPERPACSGREGRPGSPAAGSHLAVR